MLGFGWREPQLVLLDHGLYLTLSEELRQKYCELWCSFLVNDREAAAAVGAQLAGVLYDLQALVPYEGFLLYIGCWILMSTSGCPRC